MGQQHHKAEGVTSIPYILQIPSELLTEIVAFLDPKDIVQLCRVCNQVRNAIMKHDERIWKRRLNEIFPDIKANITTTEYMNEFNILESNLHTVSWKCIFFFLQHRVFRFESSCAREDVVITQDGTRVQTGIPPAGRLKDLFRILLLHPGIPRNSKGIYQVHVKIDAFGTGLWLGVSRKNFKAHTWLGEQEDSWGWGNQCNEFYWNYAGTSKFTNTYLGHFVTGDTVTMKVNMSNKTLQYIKNGQEGCLLDLNKIPGEDDLHFAIGLYEHPMQVTLQPKGFQQVPQVIPKQKRSIFKVG